MTYTAYRELTVTDENDSKAPIASFEARYRYTITAGVRSRNWTNAADGNFHPAEEPTVDVLDIAVRWHPSHQWQTVTGMAADMVCADIPDAWFIAQAMEDAA